MSTQIFSSTSDVKRLRSVIGSAIRSLPTAIDLAMMMALRDLSAAYRTSKLGYLWLVLQPALYAALFVVVKQGMSGAGFTIETGHVPGWLFALFGISVYQAWIEGLNEQLGSLRQGRDLLQTLRVPIEAFLLAPIIISMIKTTIRVLLIVAAIAIARVPVSPTSLAAIPLIFLCVFTAHAIGTLLLPFASFYEDVLRFVQSITLGLLLISPVLYPATTNTGSTLHAINVINPFAATLATARDVAFGGTFNLLWPAICWMGALGVLSVAMTLMLRVVQPLIVERLNV